MARLLLAMALGAAIGAMSVVSMRPPAPDMPAGDAAPATRSALDERAVERDFERLRAELDAIRIEAAELRRERDELRRAAQLALPSQPQARIATGVLPPDPPRRQPDQETLVDALISGGFTPQRAEWIRDRRDELMLEVIDQRNEALRRRDQGLPAASLVTLGPDQLLRGDLGDAEYELYLSALGRDPFVTIEAVLDNSAAAAVGMLPGDRITAYAGTRVFDMTDLPLLVAEGIEGEPVIVDVVRDGLPLQLVVPRGTLGVRFSGNPIEMPAEPQP